MRKNIISIHFSIPASFEDVPFRIDSMKYYVVRFNTVGTATKSLSVNDFHAIVSLQKYTRDLWYTQS